jgi:hypothetical protein
VALPPRAYRNPVNDKCQRRGEFNVSQLKNHNKRFHQLAATATMPDGSVYRFQRDKDGNFP